MATIQALSSTYASSVFSGQVFSSRKSFLGHGISPQASVSAPLTTTRVKGAVQCSYSTEVKESSSGPLRALFVGAVAALAIATASPALAAGQPRLPPLSQDPERCQKAFIGNTIGQANGVADKLLDLRFCDYSNDKTNLKGKTLSAALMADAKFDNADLTEVVMSKAYAVGASFKGTIFTNAVIDRVIFDKADLQGAQFINTVLSGSTFTDANLTDANFEDALIGYVDIQKICRNVTLAEEARGLLGCK